MQNIEIGTVSEMLSVLERLQFQFSHSAKGNSFVFRGHQNASYSLIPGVYRHFKETQHARLMDASYNGLIYSANENEMLEHFKKEAGGILCSVTQSDDFTWLQYAQHYGVPTRLLDFTANPLVALYFCCQNEQPCDGAVWVLNSHTYLRWMNKDSFCAVYGEELTRENIYKAIIRNMIGYVDDDPERVEMMRPVQFIPAYIDQRMAAQSSRFLLWGADKRPLEEMITASEEMNLSSDGIACRIADDTRFLSKLIIPNLCKHDILRALELLGISEKTVFPGLDGIGRYIEQYYRNNPDDIGRFL